MTVRPENTNSFDGKTGHALFRFLYKKWLCDFGDIGLMPCAELPGNALAQLLFEKGIKTLAEKMPCDALPRYAKNCLFGSKRKHTTLREAIRLPEHRAEYEAIKKSGDVRAIAEKEYEIADIVQMAVRNYRFKSGCQQPFDIIEKQQLNCRGGSLLGGALLLEAGVPFLLGDVPKHSVLVVTASDGTIEWHDMIAPWLNEEITDEKIEGATVADIAAFAKNPSPQGLMLDIKNQRFETPRDLPKGQRHFLTLFPPVAGLRMQILHGIAYDLIDLGFAEKDANEKEGYFSQAVLACDLSAAYEPKYEYAHNKKGEALCLLGRFEEAVQSFKKAHSINPQNAFCFYGLGNAYFELGMFAEAIKSYRQYLLLADEETEMGFVMEADARLKKFS